MSQHKCKREIKSKQDSQDKAITWDHLIRDARVPIGELRKSIRFFEKQRKGGKSFPLEVRE